MRVGLRLLLVLILTSLAHAQVEHVIQISVDGLAGKLLQKYLAEAPAEYSSFTRLFSEGAGTLNARTDFTHTVTLPNHTSMLTGRPVSPPAGKSSTVAHNYTLNSDPPDGVTLHSINSQIPYMSSTLDVAHDHGKSTAFYASKSKFSLFTESYSAERGAPAPAGRAKVDHQCLMETPGDPETPKVATSLQMHKQLMADLPAYHPGYTFIHFRDPDSAGHILGWDSPAYRKAVHNVDTQLGQLLTLLDTDPQFKGKTVIVLTADHGGVPNTETKTPKTHSFSTDANNYTIPFVVWGAGVKHGDLYELNTATRANPGDKQLDFNAPKQPIRNGEAGNLALKLLGLPAIPGSMINASQDLATH